MEEKRYAASKIDLPRGDRAESDASCFFGVFWLFIDVFLAVVAGWCSSLKSGSGVCVSLPVCVCGSCVPTPLLSEETGHQ